MVEKNYGHIVWKESGSKKSYHDPQKRKSNKVVKLQESDPIQYNLQYLVD